jgi:hypothetical protein
MNVVKRPWRKGEGPTNEMPAQTPSMLPSQAIATRNVAAANAFGARWAELEGEVERLRTEGEAWRLRAVAAEQDLQRIDDRLARSEEERAREAAISKAMHAQELKRITAELDHYKLRYARTIERLQISAKVILDALVPEQAEPAQEEQVPNLQRLADDIAGPIAPQD